MELSKLKAPSGARKSPKRVGRGPGSGWGKTASRGNKGQKARAGGSSRPGFEGGQMPLTRRLPKFGFVNPNKIRFAIVNLSDLESFDKDSVVDRESLKKAGLVSESFKGPIKVLANGEITKALTVKVSAFSKTAQVAIEKAGGKAEVTK